VLKVSKGTRLLLFSVACMQSAQESRTVEAREVLQRVRVTYNAISDYVIAVRTSAVGSPTGIPNESHIASSQGPGVNPTPSLSFSIDTENKLLLARAGISFRYELHASSTRPFLWITNGLTTWRYRPQTNEYTQGAAQPWPKQPRAGRDLSGLEWRYFSRFRQIDLGDYRATIVRRNARSDSNCEGSSTVVEIQTGEGINLVTEDLTILDKNALVCESLVRRQEYSGAGHISKWTIKTSWSYKQIAPPVDRNSSFLYPPTIRKEWLTSIPFH
jgi:hypothetical protein